MGEQITVKPLKERKLNHFMKQGWDPQCECVPIDDVKECVGKAEAESLLMCYCDAISIENEECHFCRSAEIWKKWVGV